MSITETPAIWTFLCNDDHEADDITWVHAAHLTVRFPQAGTLPDVPIGQTAIYAAEA